jgi:hypothetical protein
MKSSLCFCVCGLFNDAVSTSDCVAVNGRVVGE